MTDATNPGGGAETRDGDDRTPGRRSDEVDVVALHTPRSWWTWVLLLQGPVTWATHFMLVYLSVESWCAETYYSIDDSLSSELPTWFGFDAPVAVTLGATVLATASILTFVAFTAVRYRQATAEYRREHQDATDIDDQLVRDRQILFTGLLLGPLSAVAVLVVGVPALWLQTC